MGAGCTVECESCEYSEEFDTRRVRGEYEWEDEEMIVGDEPENCPKCGAELSFYFHGMRLRDEGREDFHSDG